MYALIVYDVGEERVSRVCKFLRQYLNWVQNSVFEGELTKGQLERIKMGVGDIIKKDADSVYFYHLRSKRWVKKEVVGQDKNLADNVL